VAYAKAARLVAALGLAVLAAGCSTSPLRVAVAPETVAALPREARVIAVHYHDLMLPRTPAEFRTLPAASGKQPSPYVLAGAPTRRIKERFVHEIQAQLPLSVRNIVEPRFVYLGRGVGRGSVPDPRWLQRTFERGLAFEFYSPIGSWPSLSGYEAKIHARLMRLDDLSVLWADSCSFEAGPPQNLPLAAPIAEAEPLYFPTALAKADACADRLLAGFLGTNRR
jgi:hypothetical protein